MASNRSITFLHNELADCIKGRGFLKQSVCRTLFPVERMTGSWGSPGVQMRRSFVYISSKCHISQRTLSIILLSALSSIVGVAEDVGKWSNNIMSWDFSLLFPVSLEQPAPVCPFGHLSCFLKETFEDTSLRLSLSPLDTGTPDIPLRPWNCFIDFAIEHWFGCRPTEHGFAGDIGAVESSLIELHRNCRRQFLAVSPPIGHQYYR